MRDVVKGIGGPVVLVGHSYGGMVIREAAAGDPAVRALVHVNAFCPDKGESALTLSGKFPGGTLADTLVSYPVATGGNEVAIGQDSSDGAGRVRRPAGHRTRCGDGVACEVSSAGPTGSALRSPAVPQGSRSGRPRPVPPRTPGRGR